MDIMNLKYYTFTKGKFAGVDNVLVSATGYTGAGGVEIYFPASSSGTEDNSNADRIWKAIFELGAPQGLKPVGLGARDTLRLEMGFCLYGNDIDDTTSPLEGGLGWITKFTKDFTAKEILEKQKTAGIQRKLIGFEMIDRGIPRHDYAIKDAAGKVIGKVTSGTQSPTLGKAVGMGYVVMAHAVLGSEIFINIRNIPVKAKVVKTPFV
jgi:aminomethyltransferase